MLLEEVTRRQSLPLKTMDGYTRAGGRWVTVLVEVEATLRDGVDVRALTRP